MGIGFVLLVWAVLLGAAAVVWAVVLGFWSWWNQRRAFGRRGAFRIVAAAALPFLLLGYGGAAFAGYAIWCEAVDAGIGDGWRVPVGNDHYFCMIDVPEDGYLLKGGCSGAPIVRGINELGAAGDLLVGNSESSGPFVLNTQTAELQTFVSVDAALAGIKPQPILRSAGEFYDDRRWGRADVVAAVLIGGPAIATAIVWYSCFIRRSPARDDAAVATPS